MTKISLITFIILITCTIASAEPLNPDAQNFGQALSKSSTHSKLLGKLVIENRQEGEIYFLNSKSEKKVLGKVVIPANQWSDKPFEASNWAPEGVAATAVNAIHLKKLFGDDPDKRVTRLITLLPKQMLDIDPAKWKSYMNASSSIYTDIPVNEKIFGGLYAPFLGSKIEFGEKEIPEQITISYQIPDPMPLWVTFENKFGGKITIKYPGQDEIHAGVVYRPVYGVGRFEGTIFCDIGRIRAVHAGVIDVCTSPMGEVGGIQIVPYFHANTTQATYIRLLTQWMVIGPLDPTQQDMGYLSDLFVTLEPRFAEITTDAINEGIQPVRSRYHAVAKFRGDTKWRNFPPLSGKIDDALEPLEEIRIYFPDLSTFDFDS